MTSGFCWEKWTNGSEWFLNAADDAWFLIENALWRLADKSHAISTIVVCRHVRSCHSRFQKQNKIPQNWKNILPSGHQPVRASPGNYIKQNHPRFSAEAETRMICVKKLHDWGPAEKKEYLSKRLRDTAWIITYFLGGSKWNMFVVIRYALKIN